MESGTRAQLESKWHQIRGKIREAFGKIIHNSELTCAGKTEHISGQVQGEIRKINAMMLHGYK